MKGATKTPAALDIVTPEGLPLHLQLATVADRGCAFCIDCAVVFAVLFLVGLVMYLIAGSGSMMDSESVLIALAMLLLFFVRHGYFIACEAGRQGRTFGKRLMGLRVIDRQGGPLTTEAVVARNLTREVEVFLPLTGLAMPEGALGMEGFPALVALVWLGVLGLLPLFNSHRLRLGDMLAGTLVVQASPAALDPELVKSSGAQSSGISFRLDQLSIYGVYELQVLEQLLRRRPRDFDGLKTVARSVQRKIGWQTEGDQLSDLAFLEAFYQAQRGRLEQDLELGDVRAHKHDDSKRKS